MKICFVGLGNLPVLAPEYNRHGIGGEEVQQTLMARYLAKQGHQISMVVADMGQADGARWDGVTTFRTYRSDAGLPILRFIYPRWTSVWDALRRADADVYYVSCAGMQLGLVAMFCKKYGRKLVFKIAHDRDCDPNDLIITYARDKKLYAYGLRRADVVIAQSEQQQRAMLKNYGRNSVVAEMIVDGAKQLYDLSDRQFDVLWVNNLRQFKRPDLLLELAKRLPQLSFHMIGGPQPGFAELYEVISAQAQTIPNLTFHGRVPYHDMDKWYARAKVFVNTSDTEGFPNSYLQSWVRGTPAVAFFDPDGVIARESLGVAARDMAHMANAVEKLVEDTQRWHVTSARCLEYMAQVYGEDRIMSPYIKIFEELS